MEKNERMVMGCTEGLCNAKNKQEAYLALADECEKLSYDFFSLAGCDIQLTAAQAEQLMCWNDTLQLIELRLRQQAGEKIELNEKDLYWI